MSILVLVLELGTWAVLLAAAFHLLRLAKWGWGRPLARVSLVPAEFPVVTVQLPICNERHVAERVLRAACALEWPRDRLEVQALDDSDDDTRAIVDRVAAELRAAGHDIKVLRRDPRQGFKAGNLAHGLQHARGEYIAVLDADSVPPANFLTVLMAALAADAQLGFAQARWSFDNQSRSLLTRVQALILDGLMLVEQARLSALARPLQFNGSGGVWRRTALERAGGWIQAAGSVTEDLDLSYRAQLAGFRGAQLPELAVETELPESMAAFRAQQQRWVRGAGQVLRALAHKLFQSGATAGDRVSMLAHLLRHARQPMLALLVLWLPLTSLGLARPLVALPYAWPLVIAIVWFAVGAYQGAALTRLGRSPGAAFVLAPAVMALSLGLAPALAYALASGSRAEWRRTPKRGRTGDAAGAAYRAPGSAFALVEIAVAIAYGALAGQAIVRGDGLAAAGFAWVAAGYAWVGLGSLGR
jgi:cellulose synthase/poly-beta-1,6-N-acetylglucosamine synthase-like glycosyltransferase